MVSIKINRRLQSWRKFLNRLLPTSTAVVDSTTVTNLHKDNATQSGNYTRRTYYTYCESKFAAKLDLAFEFAESAGPLGSNECFTQLIRRRRTMPTVGIG